MNTDNMAVSGETIDYGPCAFIDAYDPETVFSSIDSRGRYAFGNQPGIAQWNLARFAETLLPLLDSEPQRAIDQAMSVIQNFPALFAEKWTARLRAKLGWLEEEPDDLPLAKEFLDWLTRHSLDYTNSFRRLAAMPLDDADFAAWHSRWQQRRERGIGNDPERRQRADALMRSHNPSVIPRNHRVEEVLSAAVDEGELEPLERLLAALQQPYEDRPEFDTYREPPPSNACRYRTFCGT
jgi:uncharacterized protein YdiU (UPF0061 family)